MTRIRTKGTTDELDLTDKATLDALMNADVLASVKDQDTEQAEAAIANLKPVKLTIELSPSEHAVITRQAAASGISPKEFIHRQLRELLIDKSVGKPLISAPSTLSGHAVTKKVTATNFTR